MHMKEQLLNNTSIPTMILSANIVVVHTAHNEKCWMYKMKYNVECISIVNCESSPNYLLIRRIKENCYKLLHAEI